MYVLDERLREYATDTQWSYLQALAAHGSQREAAKKLGKDQKTIWAAKRAVEKKAAIRGYAPDHGWQHPTPEGYKIKGMSTLRDAQTGEARLIWEKSVADEDKRDEARQAALSAMLEELPKPERVKKEKHHRLEDHLNQYTITDFHLGMLAWGEEAGEDYDTKIAEELLVNWFAAALQQSPKAKVGILAQLGDFLHWDGMDAVTPESRHVLDADTRFQNVVRVAIRVLRQVVNMMRAKYETVHIIMADANHDPASGIWLREMFAAMYEGDDGVTVDTSPDTYYCYSWGDTSLFYHHGHKKRGPNVAAVFAQKFRDVWGNSKHAYAHTGHLHHTKVDESNNLMVVEQHRTLAAKDAYASRGGWMAGRSASVITYRKEHGEVGRVTLTPEMVS